jgi:pimeloyl-ACP methyl ester carboxylesterase
MAGSNMSVCSTLRSDALPRVGIAAGWAPAALLAACSHPATSGDTRMPLAALEAECRVHIAFDRNAEFPGYMAPDGACVPYTPLTHRPPAGYVGDYYADEFTDAKIRARWEVCKSDSACAAAVRAKAHAFMEREFPLTGSVDPEGWIDPEGPVDLARIRTPRYFGRLPLNEAIASADASTYVVEFTLPPDPYERIALRRIKPVKVRGWYMVGSGVTDGHGRRRRALVIMNNGGGMEMTARDDPREDGILRDSYGREYPAQTAVPPTEVAGQRHWRGFLAALWEAGFDVLALDRRGNGISGGISSRNTAEQGRDMFREIAQLESGRGLRILGPMGEKLEGRAAARRLMQGVHVRKLPIILGGWSRGSYAVAWAMQQNVVGDCRPDSGGGQCNMPQRWPNIRGAILYGPNAGGIGYRFAPRGDLLEGALRTEYHTAYYPDGSVLANIHRWPGVAIIRGSWDGVESLQGSLDAIGRARTPKRLFVFRGAHLLNRQAPENMRLAGQEMVRFAHSATLGNRDSSVPGWTVSAVVAATPAISSHTQ